jgi:hypothetical protein
MLYRPLYRGEIVWNRTRKRDAAWGVVKQRGRPPADWLHVPVPSLRIVSDELWQAAQERLQGSRATYLRDTQGQLWGKPTRGNESKYLLTGLTKCGLCGGGLFVHSRSHGRKRAFFYACTSYHTRGRAVCTNADELPMEQVDREVLEALEHDLLAPPVIDHAVRTVLTRLRRMPRGADLERARLQKALQETEQELAQLTHAIAAGGPLETLLAGVKERERRRVVLQQELRAFTAPATLPEANVLLPVLQARLEDWRGLVTRHVPQARQLIRKLIEDRIIFRPILHEGARACELIMQGSLVKILSGSLDPKALASPTGTDGSKTLDFWVAA